MPDQQEELKLVVTLVDNASAGLANLRNQSNELVNGRASQGIQRFKRDHEDLNKVMKDTVELATGGSRALLGMVAAYGAVGLAIAKTTGIILDYSKQMAQINKQGSVLGFNPGEFKYMQEQMMRVGVSSEAAARSLLQFNAAMVELSHTGGAKWAEMIEMSHGHAGAMAKAINDIETATTDWGAAMIAVEQSRNVYQNRYIENQEKVRRGIISERVAILDANAAANQFLNTLGLDPLLRRIMGAPGGPAPGQLEMYKQITENAEQVEKGLIDIELAAIKVKDEMILAFGPGISELLKNTAKEIETIVQFFKDADDLIKKIQGAAKDFWQQGANTSLGPGVNPQFYGNAGAAGGIGNQFANTDWGRFMSGARPSGNVLDYRGAAPTGGAAPYGSSVGPGTGEGAGSAPVASPTGGGTAPAGGGGGATLGDLDRGAYDKMFAGTPLAGQYENVVAAAQANNVPPSLVAGVMAQETGRGTSAMLRNRNNPAGLMDPATHAMTGQNFPNVEAGITEAGRRIGINYRRGGGTIAGMAGIYAPPGAANDPRGLNKGWPAGVSNFQKQLSANVNGQDQPAAAPTVSAQAMRAATGQAPEAFIMHHTGGGGDIAGLQSTLRQRGLGVEYAMDRQGNIVQIGQPGASNIMNESRYRSSPILGKGHPFLTNRNIVGMEVIARDDRDVTPAQVAAAKKFISENYPGTPVFGHGEVNPGHKEADEGMKITSAIRSARAGMDQTPAVAVNASGKLDVNVNAPPGTNVKAGGDGLFKNTEVTRQVQMTPAAGAAGNRSPAADPNL